MRITAKILVAVFFVTLLTAIRASGHTSIVVARTSEFAIIAADSKVTWTDAPAGSACKIGRVGGMLFAIGGLAVSRDTGWNAMQAASSAASTARGAVRRAVDAFERDAQRELPRAFENLRVKDPAEFDKWTPRTSLEILFVGIEKNSVILIHSKYKFNSEHKTLKVISESCPGSCKDGPVQIAVLGRRAAVDRRLRDVAFVDPSPSGIATLVTSLVELEIADVPEEVGGPIDVVRLNRDRSMSTINRGAC